MDPDTNLGEQREIIARMNEAAHKDPDDFDADVMRLAELMEALDGWISKGGFLPKAWQR